MKEPYRRWMCAPLLGVTLLGVFWGSATLSALEVPKLRGRVNDLAGVMPTARASQLEERLRRFEEQTGHQIAVLIIPSLEGENLEAFSIQVAETWKIGHKGFDNGAILLIARDDRKLRIEVGYGLEGVLPDAIASRIIREVIVPHFRSNDYPGGIEAGVEAIMTVARGESLPAPARTRTGQKDIPGAGTDVGDILFLLLSTSFVALFVGMWVALSQAFRRESSSEFGRAFVGGALGAVASAVHGALFGALQLGLGLWILMVLLGAVISGMASRTRFKDSEEWSGGRRRRDRYWPGGPGSDYGGGASGGGGGGFGGGGGGFGGGGASGSW